MYVAAVVVGLRCLTGVTTKKDLRMIDFKLANVILKVEDHAAKYPQLYYRAGKGVAVYDSHSECLRVTGQTDFFTYVNALSLCKWRTYAGVSEASLHIELSGTGTIQLLSVPSTAKLSTGVDYTSTKAKEARQAEVTSSMRVLATQDFSGAGLAFDLSFGQPKADLVGFTVVPKQGETVEVRKAYYFAKVDESNINPVRLALSTTTFNNEKYILPNIELVKRGIAEEGGAVADNFHMFVVDNGRTLDAEGLSDSIVTVIPNPNTGGAGGFARGMMAATEEGSTFTHVLLMDDDVSIMPESLIRTYNLLALAQGAYRNAFINGAMLSLEQPVRMFEDVSVVDRTGVYRKIKPDFDMGEIADMLENERENVELEQVYGAWWYSCIPLSAVRENGLPMPFFIRCDDIEFGLRNKPVYMTMNGICVWHASFEGRFRPSVDWYQYVRNFAATNALRDCYSELFFVERLRRSLRQNLRDLDYVAAEMMLEGFNDYLKGPCFLQQVDGSSLMKSNGARNEKLVPISQLDQDVLRESGVTEEVLSNKDMNDYTTYAKSYARTLPYDKHYLPDAVRPKKIGYVVKYGDSILEGSSFGCETLVFIDPLREKGIIRKLDMQRYKKIKAFAHEVFSRYRKEGRAVRQAWKDAQPYMTSREFWEKYLAQRLAD